MSKSIITVAGFILIGSGLLSLIYKMIGLQLSWLVWIDNFGGVVGLFIRLIMIFGGFILVYVTRTKMDI